MDTKSANFISLKEATMLCDCSQDYLNLLARKGYLKAMKIGRNWVTKKEWLQEYLHRIEQKKSRIAEKTNNNIASIHGAKISSDNCDAPANSATIIPAVSVSIRNDKINLSTRYREKILTPDQSLFVRFSSSLKLNNLIAFGCLSLCAAVLLGSIFFSQRESLVAGIDYLLANSGAASRLESAQNFVSRQRSEVSLSRTLSSADRAISAAADNFLTGLNGIATDFGIISNGAKEKIAGFVDYVIHGKTEVVVVSSGPEIDRIVLEKSTDVLEKNIVNDTHGRIDQFRKEFNLQVLERSSGNSQGIVAVPLEGDIEAAKEKIKKSFSDEVAVKPADDISGVIVPQFKDKLNQEYLYMMVPVNGNN